MAHIEYILRTARFRAEFICRGRDFVPSKGMVIDLGRWPAPFVVRNVAYRLDHDTIHVYLEPTPSHLEIVEWYGAEEFAERLKGLGWSIEELD